MFQKIENFVLDCVFPTYCLGCGRFLKSEAKTHLCPDCRNKISVNSGLFCPICFKRIAAGNFNKCRHSAKASSLDFLGIAVSYENPLVRELIHKYKYGFAKEISQTLSEILIRYWEKTCPDDLKRYCLVAVPLHRQRFNWRGFNQSEELAKILSQRLSLPLNNNCLIRRKKTASQAEIKDFQERKNNLQNAFSLKNQGPLENKNIILLDDVFTSGATMEAAAAALKSGGAKRIIGLAIAK
ncbi:MAG TPA: ComF family protein [Candidatus Paceibacterota bacterium]|nr:ComF family protein [Candidatus Paceibacterota bacterium]HRY76780.1 ComF family protein [Candidatus Paceibacterota bacterium]